MLTKETLNVDIEEIGIFIFLVDFGKFCLLMNPVYHTGYKSLKTNKTKPPPKKKNNNKKHFQSETSAPDIKGEASPPK